MPKRGSSRVAMIIRQACDTCHARKIRCLPATAGSPGPCQRCYRDGAECTYSPALKTGRPRKARPSNSSPQIEPTKETASLSPGTTSSDHGQAAPSTHVADGDNEDLNANANAGHDVAQYYYDEDGDDGKDLEEMLPNLRGSHDIQALVLSKFERYAILQQQMLGQRRVITALFAQPAPPTRAIRSEGLQELLGLAAKVIDMHRWLMKGWVRFECRRQMMFCLTDESSLTALVLPAMMVVDIFVETLRLVFPEVGEGTSEPDSETWPTARLMMPKDIESLGVPDASMVMETPALPSDQSLQSEDDEHRMNAEEVEEPRNPMSEFVFTNQIQEQLNVMRQVCDPVADTLPRVHAPPGSQRLMALVMERYAAKLDLLQGHISRAGNGADSTRE